MKIVVYSKSACPNCTAAKQLLDKENLVFTEYSLDDQERLAAFCQANPGIRQMPQIFINGQRVGGIDGLSAALKQVGL